jgi:hypothetical protein
MSFGSAFFSGMLSSSRSRYYVSKEDRKKHREKERIESEVQRRIKEEKYPIRRCFDDE